MLDANVPRTHIFCGILRAVSSRRPNVVRLLESQNELQECPTWVSDLRRRMFAIDSESVRPSTKASVTLVAESETCSCRSQTEDSVEANLRFVPDVVVKQSPLRTQQAVQAVYCLNSC